MASIQMDQETKSTYLLPTKKKPTHLHFKDKHHHRVRDGQTMKWNQEVSRSHYPTNKIDFELKLVKEIKRDTSF